MPWLGLQQNNKTAEAVAVSVREPDGLGFSGNGSRGKAVEVTFCAGRVKRAWAKWARGPSGWKDGVVVVAVEGGGADRATRPACKRKELGKEEGGGGGSPIRASSGLSEREGGFSSCATLQAVREPRFF